jgi:hypothetical protein
LIDFNAALIKNNEPLKKRRMRMELTKEAIRSFSREFFPRGKTVKTCDWNFRRTEEDEIYRCCLSIGSDSQSGPFFCGKVADYVAFPEEDGAVVGAAALCESHFESSWRTNYLQTTEVCA